MMPYPNKSKSTEMGTIIHQHESAAAMSFPWEWWEVQRGEEQGGGDAIFGSYPTNLVPLGPSCSTGLTRLSPSLRAGSFLGRCSLLCPQDNETHTHPHTYTKHTLGKSVKAH